MKGGKHQTPTGAPRGQSRCRQPEGPLGALNAADAPASHECGGCTEKVPPAIRVAVTGLGPLSPPRGPGRGPGRHHTGTVAAGRQDRIVLGLKEKDTVGAKGRADPQPGGRGGHRACEGPQPGWSNGGQAAAAGCHMLPWRVCPALPTRTSVRLTMWGGGTKQKLREVTWLLRDRAGDTLSLKTHCQRHSPTCIIIPKSDD